MTELIKNLSRWLPRIESFVPGLARQDVAAMICSPKLQEQCPFVFDFYELCNGVDVADRWVLSLSDSRETAAEWLSALEAVDKEDLVVDNAGPVAPVWWSEKWWPVVEFDGGNLCIDLDPKPGGRIGQLIRVFAQSNRREVIFDSFQEWWERVDQLFNDGALVLVPTEQGHRCVLRNPDDSLVFLEE